MPTAVIYARISQDRAGAGLGVDRQTEDCRALAARLGWDVATVFTDNDVSAYSGRRRPAYEDMLALLETGTVHGVLAWHTDRLHRSPRELERYIDLTERHGVVTHTVKAGELDLSTPSGRAIARTLGAWARYESEHKSERVRRAMHQGAQAGKFLGGAVPFGWTIINGTPVIHDTEAAEVRAATRAVLAGRSLGSIIRDLNDRGITTGTGRPWTYATLRQLLLRPRNAGLAEWHGEIVGDSQFPAIVTRDEWEGVRNHVTNPARRRSQSNRIRHLLAGLAVCGVCGEPMKSATAGNRDGTRRTVYRCKAGGIGHPVRTAAPIDELVTETIIGVLSRPDAAAALATGTGADVTALRADDMALRARLEHAAEQFADGAITGGQLATITARIQERLRAVAAELAAAQPSPAVADMLAGDNVRAAWEAADVETRRAVVDALAVVTIDSTGRAHGKEFDPATVRITAKGATDHA
ncbi:recombinase family protein [Kocuria rosea]|uniref:recombinase family protein n=1 Tax=Kocuria rosea TaxID=1275 RepID=UPI000DF95F61|nr:recombinase family protein [Kocuria rosea]STX02467.1 Resolvase, N terminal domain [Kocuria rosea]